MSINLIINNQYSSTIDISINPDSSSGYTYVASKLVPVSLATDISDTDWDAACSAVALPFVNDTTILPYKITLNSSFIFVSHNDAAISALRAILIMILYKIQNP